MNANDSNDLWFVICSKQVCPNASNTNKPQFESNYLISINLENDYYEAGQIPVLHVFSDLGTLQFVLKLQTTADQFGASGLLTKLNCGPELPSFHLAVRHGDGGSTATPFQLSQVQKASNNHSQAR